jgi:DNA-directed RNA polymerase specialized sigma24 family protein
VTVEGKRIAVRRPGVWRRHRQSAPDDGAPITAEALWAQLRARPAPERQAVIRAHLRQLAPHEVARLLALSAAAARLEVLERLARRDDVPRQPTRDSE